MRNVLIPILWQYVITGRLIFTFFIEGEARHFSFLISHFSFNTRVPIASFATLRLVEFLDNDEVTLLITGNDHLGNTLAIVDDEVVL